MTDEERDAILDALGFDDDDDIPSDDDLENEYGRQQEYGDDFMPKSF